MREIILIATLAMSACVPWAVKADCWGGGKWNEEWDAHAEMKCGIKTEVTLFKGGK